MWCLRHKTFSIIYQIPALTLGAIIWLYANGVNAAQSLNVLIYHHIDANTPRATSVTPDEFAAHMDFLHTQNYQVISLSYAIKTLQTGGELPERSVAISFDDAWRSVYDNGVPIIEKYGFPYTIFVNTDFVDGNIKMAMTWDMLRDVKNRGGHLANHTRDHDYLVRYNNYDQAWLTQVLDNINHAQQRLEKETGITEKWLAYPYGEYNEPLKKALKKQGYIAFGQQSGGIAPFSDWLALPRFSAAGNYSALEKLKVKLNSQPMPIVYSDLPDPVIDNKSQDQNPPLLRITLSEILPASSRHRLTCFIQNKAYQPEWLDNLTWQVQANAPLPSGRARYNCTAPVPGSRNYYWLSQQWLIK